MAAACSRLVSRIDAGQLDCVSDDLALLLAVHDVSDVRSPFAQDWRFDLVEQSDGPPRVDLPPAGQDELLGQRTGWRPCWQPIVSIGEDAPRWREALGAGHPVLLVGDGFYLPWLPYRGHEHMDHGFVLAGLGAASGAGGELAGGELAGGELAGGELVADIVDPYDNVTEWGAARPQATRLPVHDLQLALHSGRWGILIPARRMVPIRPAEQVAANAAAILASADAGAYQHFAASHQQAGLPEMRNLSLQTWLLARNRALHARWLAGLPTGAVDPAVADRFRSQVSGGWQRAMEMSYIALRRVRSGRAAPSAAITAVRSASDAEVRLASSLLGRLPEVSAAADLPIRGA